jgi:hypothetical protein
MKRSGLDAKQKPIWKYLESNLNEIVSPLSRKLSYDYLGFTPTEIKVATMVKQGRKGAGDSPPVGHLHPHGGRISICHPRPARHQGKKVNLRTYLLAIR